MSGGKVIVPRLDTGMAVMLHYCNAAACLSSRERAAAGIMGGPATGAAIPSRLNRHRMFSPSSHPLDSQISQPPSTQP
jgi:hypothetical protein